MTPIVGAQVAPVQDTAPEGISVRRLETLAEYEECCDIQRETWGPDFTENVPVAILLVAQKIGGVTAGAFDRNGRMLGFVFGLTGVRDGRLVHWSDMLAVREEARGHRLGAILKQYQRREVRALGVETMLWTFDPLVARNAHLNINLLGARAAEYVPDMYGSNTGSALHGALATDRFIVAWDLADDAAPARRVTGESSSTAPLLDPTRADGLPALVPFPDANSVRVQVPADVHGLDRETMARWRDTTRGAFLAAFDHGFRVTGFDRGDTTRLPSYVLERSLDGSHRT
jgi:predicted GNAT superfamily acetyltransferase